MFEATRVAAKRLFITVNISPHLARLSEDIDCLIMSGSLQTLSINGHDTITCI